MEVALWIIVAELVVVMWFGLRLTEQLGQLGDRLKPFEDYLRRIEMGIQELCRLERSK